MSAGTGVMHSEKNASDSELVHFLQIWIMPEKHGIEPGYEQKTFPAEERDGRLRLVAARDGREGALTIHQDVDLYTGTLHGKSIEFPLRPGRFGWIQVTRGTIHINGTPLEAGDGASIEGETSLKIEGDGEILLFDLN
jgi:Pirin-related protein